MKLTPVLTEKSLNLAKNGKYTFWVSGSLTKTDIKFEIKKVFGVDAKSVRTVNIGGELKRNSKGRKVEIAQRKKAIIALKEGQKLDIFEEKKSK